MLSFLMPATKAVAVVVRFEFEFFSKLNTIYKITNPNVHRIAFSFKWILCQQFQPMFLMQM